MILHCSFEDDSNRPIPSLEEEEEEEGKGAHQQLALTVDLSRSFSFSSSSPLRLLEEIDKEILNRIVMAARQMYRRQGEETEPPDRTPIHIAAAQEFAEP